MRRFVVPTSLTVIMLGTLLWLGVWQVHRLAWKEALLGRIDAAQMAPAVVLGAGKPADFAKISVSGVWHPGAVAFLGAELGGDENNPEMGAHLLQVLDRPGLAPVLVNRGWVATSRGLRGASGAVTVTGYARPREVAGMLSASDDLAGRHFYAIDPGRIGAALGVPGVEAGFSLVALGDAVCSDTPCPVAAKSLPRPMNNHLQYAATWFGLAGVLVVVYGVWAAGQLRSRVST